MKNWMVFFAMIYLSCSPDSENTVRTEDLNGVWQLKEILMDPGDGSGQFESTDLDITLKIENNDKVTANGILCGFGISQHWLQGTLTLQDSVISTPCQNGELRHKIHLNTPYLVLSNMSCREPCRARFIKID